MPWTRKIVFEAWGALGWLSYPSDEPKVLDLGVKRRRRGGKINHPLTKIRPVSSGSTVFFRLIVKEVVEKYLDCGNPRCGFARIQRPDCAEERLVMFSCRTRGFCPSCHAKRIEEWGEWMRETLLLDVPHRQVVFTIPKMLRVFFKFKRRLLGDLCRCALRSPDLILRGCDWERAYAGDLP